jgi:hypothetical protein
MKQSTYAFAAIERQARDNLTLSRTGMTVRRQVEAADQQSADAANEAEPDRIGKPSRQLEIKRNQEHVTDAFPSQKLINVNQRPRWRRVPCSFDSISIMRTYTSSRSSRIPLHSSSPSDLSAQGYTKKRPLVERLAFHNTPQPLKRARTIASSSTSISKHKPKNNHKYRSKEDRPPKALTQLHFTLDSSVLRTCPLCDLTYTKGAPEDETLHNSHCARVQRGMQWRRDEERAATEAKVSEIATTVKLKDGKSGRIISINADSGGKIGSKVCFNNPYGYSSDEMLNDYIV